MSQTRVLAAIEACRKLPEAERIAVYNAATAALRSLVADVCDDPVLGVQLVPAALVVANDYNPNKVAAPEMDLLEHSIRSDGLTMPVVVVRDGKAGRCVVIDGFHRRMVCVERLLRRFLPVTVIARSLADRMAATIRHNRARGKHQVDLMATLVKGLLALGWDDLRIADHLGMTPEELLRLKQVVGVAPLLAAGEYSQSWGLIEGEDGDADAAANPPR